VPRLGEADLERVRGIPLFDGLEPEWLRSLIGDAWAIAFEAPTLLFSQGDPADGFFVVLAGRVRLFVLTADGRESVLEFIDPGQSFAEAAMFGSGLLPVNADVEAGTRLVRIPAKPILAGIKADAALARKMLDSLARRQRRLIGRIGTLKLQSPGQRLAAALLALSTVDFGATTVHLGMTKAGLASQIGITPESLSRAMARLRGIGVSCRGHDVSIADVSVLRRYCEDQGPEA
jgi:CRP-like cAMP-binding protein